MLKKNFNISLNEKQLDKIVEKLQHKEPRKKFSIDKLLNLIQIIALVISGCWIFYKYLAHEKLSDELSTQNLKLQKDNLQLQNSLHQQMDNYTLRLSQMDVQKAKQDSILKEVDLRYAERMAGIQYNSMSLENESQRINLKYADALKKLEEEHNKFQVKNDSVNYRNKTHRKIETPYTFSIKKRELLSNNKNLYEATINIQIHNISDVELKICGVVIELYLSEFDLKPSEYKDIRQNFVEYPPDMFNHNEFSSTPHYGLDMGEDYEKNEREEIKKKRTVWVFIKRKSGYDSQSFSILQKRYPYYFDLKNKDCNPGQFSTGLYQPNEKAGFEYKFFFEAYDSYIAGVSTNIILNDAKDNYDQCSFGFYRVLKYLESDFK